MLYTQALEKALKSLPISGFETIISRVKKVGLDVCDFEVKLPRNKREFTLFMMVISIISVNIIAPLITCFEVGFRMEVWAEAIKMIPFIWLTVIALVLITYKPAGWLAGKIIEKDDSFAAHIVVNILCSVLLMSIFLTVIGTWIGNRQVSMEPIVLFFYKWPRNFAISLVVEALIAQPIARLVILKLHQIKDGRLEAENR